MLFFVNLCSNLAKEPVFWSVLCGLSVIRFYSVSVKAAVTMSDSPGRPMKFPYTFTAKMAQFPIKFYIQNQWIWRYWMVGIAVSLPVFYKIHKLANSPENVSKWAEIRRKEAAGHH